ncbi:MAG: hypothetical protein JJ992_03315, partial [Planctomycetes bacterium]|nr:hypothetical protein [Planctomycetota bacterium]
RRPPPAAEAATDASEGGEASDEYTDLVGKWLAQRNEDRFGLIIDQDGRFQWAAIPKGKQRVTLSGEATTSGDMLILESGEQGTMAGQVKSAGPDKFQFIIAGGPPNDEGLTFERVKEGGDEPK